MIIRSALFLFVFCQLTLCAQTTAWQWAKNAKGTYGTSGVQIGIDSAGNSAVVGSFACHQLSFDTCTLTNPGAQNLSFPQWYKFFLARYDARGNAVWARTGESYQGNGHAVAFDPAGNVCMAGTFKDQLQLEDTLLISPVAGDHAMFLAKYNAAGRLLWARTSAGNASFRISSLKTDRSGNIVTAGYFIGSTPVLDHDTLIPINTGTTVGGSNVFVARFDPAGKLLWATCTGAENVRGLCIDKDNSVLITGCFRTPAITWGGTTLTNSGIGTYDLFVAKCDSAGNPTWAVSAGGNTWDWSSDLSLDPQGNVWVSGHFQSSSLSFGAVSAAGSGKPFVNTSLFLAKYNAAGHILWAKSSEAGNYLDGAGPLAALCNRTNGNALVTGVVNGDKVRVLGGRMAVNGSFMAEVDAAGNVLGVKSTAGVSDIVSGPLGDVYATGGFRGSSGFDDITLKQSSAYPADEFFIAKLRMGPAGLREIPAAPRIFPNPVSTEAELQWPEPLSDATLLLTDCLGRKIREYRNVSLGAGESFYLMRSGLSAGVYLLHWSGSGTNEGTVKLIIKDL